MFVLFVEIFGGIMFEFCETIHVYAIKANALGGVIVVQDYIKIPVCRVINQPMAAASIEFIDGIRSGGHGGQSVGRCFGKIGYKCSGSIFLWLA
jgi:hypothetical protein